MSPTVLLGHTEALKHAPAKYPINRVECNVFSTPRENLSGNWPNVFRGQLPNQIVVGLVDADAFNGTSTKNPFNFKNYKTNFCGLVVNGEHTPHEPLQIRFDAGADDVSAFQSLYSRTNKLFPNDQNGISRDENPEGYTLVVFNFPAALCNRVHLSLVRDSVWHTSCSCYKNHCSARKFPANIQSRKSRSNCFRN